MYYRVGDIFHICNKSIANFGIFKDHRNMQRFVNTLTYYNTSKKQDSYSLFLRKKKQVQQNLLNLQETNLVKFLAFCIMPDHYHLLIKIVQEHIFYKYMNDVENSFSRYFNIRFERKGPLWQNEFKSVRIRSNEQLLHVSRYIHLNPTTNYLVEKPEQWEFSSYRQYISEKSILKKLTEISIVDPHIYKKFVENQIDYQRSLKKIKRLTLEKI